MFECNGNFPGKRIGMRQHLVPVFTTVILLLLGPAASFTRAQDHSTEELRKLNQSVGALIKKVSPSVVQILVTGYGPLEEADHGNTNTVIGRQRAIGSGF